MTKIIRICLLLVVVGVLGCFGSGKNDKWTKDRPPTYSVKGTVTFDGKPLADASIVFRPTVGENAAVGRTNQQGEFTLQTFEEQDGAVAGDFQVSVTAVKIEGPPPGANLDEINPVTKEIWLIPQNYGDFKKSGLTATVTKSGPNVFDLTLTSKK